ncbi:MAG: 2OG-Fe(II) oxygenase family protein [Candidatus Puniceispirillales bacterium]
MFNIQRIDVKNKNAKNNFFISFQNTGFAVIENHDISFELIDNVYSEWEEFFNSEEKINYKFDTNSQDGFFPFRSESAKDNPIKDLKEFFHVYPNTNLPNFLSKNTKLLYSELVSLGNTLLGWLDDLTPNNIKSEFSESLFNMSKGSDRNLLRVLHYPPVEGEVEQGATRAAAHEDINLITLLVSGSQPGLEAMDMNGVWHKVPVDKGMITVNVGDMLQMASNKYFPSTSHRVVNPKNAKQNVSRFSLPMFMHPRNEVILRSGITAYDYLQERLKEINLK